MSLGFWQKRLTKTIKYKKVLSFVAYMERLIFQRKCQINVQKWTFCCGGGTKIIVDGTKSRLYTRYKTQELTAEKLFFSDRTVSIG
jgi:hypothetical protein